MVRETNSSLALSNIEGTTRTTGLDDDLALVSSSQKGNLDAFELLVMKHQKRMLNIAFRLMGDYEEACEVVQDAFLAAYRKIREFRGDAKFTTWLTAITVNLSKNSLKKMQARRKHVAFSLDGPLQTENGPLAIDPPSQKPSVLDQLVRRDIQNSVHECIQKLDLIFREVLILRDMQDFSYDDICRMLKMREGTVKSRLFRAREMVKNCLKLARGDL